MPGPLKINSRVEIPETELLWKFSRSGGPGGQSVNTADSKVHLSFNVQQSNALSDVMRSRALNFLHNRLVDGVLTIVASEYRSQWKNRLAAEQRMAELLSKAIAPPAAPRRPTKPTKSSKQARVESKRHRGEIKRLRKSTDE